jgi:hypothetical protein
MGDMQNPADAYFTLCGGDLGVPEEGDIWERPSAIPIRVMWR